MTRVLAFDPGLITGIAVGDFTETDPVTLTWAGTRTYEQMLTGGDFIAPWRAEHVVVEQFILRDNDFRADLTGVRVEGVLDSQYHPIQWRPPSKKSQVPDQILHDNGLWQTGRTVDWTDGRDANDAIIHMIGYVAFDLKHRPTLRRYFK